MKKINLLIICFLSILFLGVSLISGVCCERLKSNGKWCQIAESSDECDAGYHSWTERETCAGVIECEGTCVNEETGECSQGVSKSECINSQGKWYETEEEETDKCQKGCCIIGENAYFVNSAECSYYMTIFNARGTFREDLTSRDECEEQQSLIKKGACVISTPYEKACIMSTNLDCVNTRITELSKNLNNPSLSNNINVRFYDGLLCSAPGLSDCEKSKNTGCKDYQVYYKDTCGNFANIYDSTKYNNQDYWTYLKDPEKDELCSVSSSGSNTCGNCNIFDNTVCMDIKETSFQNTENNNNKLVCGELTCKYNGKKYKHGESWCAETPGTIVIERDPSTGKIYEKNITTLKKGYEEYNIPGSSYYMLTCSFGEIIVESCGDYRNRVCIQEKNEDKTSSASCIVNPWRVCFQIDTKTGCENTENDLLCKWIPGYRFDLEIVPENQRKEKQGSCVPLIAPGFDFWNENSNANLICYSQGSVQDFSLFETSWMNKRENFADWSDATHSQQCLNGCYLIPDYGKEFNQGLENGKVYPEDVECSSGKGVSGSKCKNWYSVLTEFYDESEFSLIKKIKEYHLSLRRGQYCHKEGKPDQWLTGKVDGENYDCTPTAGSEGKDEEKERDYPIYLTNQEWLNNTIERAHSLGDCGYKVNINGEYSSPDKEIITAIFQKLSQKGEVKKNIGVEQIIYQGNKDKKYLSKPVDYETELPFETEYYSCYDKGGICITTLINSEPCPENIISEGTCNPGSVCCAYEGLE